MTRLRFPIRPAAPFDAEGIARVHVQAWRESYAGIIPTEELALMSIAERAQRWRHILTLPGPDEGVFVAAHEGHIVAFGDCGRQRSSALPFDGHEFTRRSLVLVTIGLKQAKRLQIAGPGASARSRAGASAGPARSFSPGAVEEEVTCTEKGLHAGVGERATRWPEVVGSGTASAWWPVAC